MNIDKALSLKHGDTVFCPADRGDPAKTGTVKSVSHNVNKNIRGVEYVWVTVQHVGHGSVWPSNRL